MGSSSSSGLGSGSDSCGNNTSIVCNNEDLVITKAINKKSADTYLPTLYITSLPNSLKPSDL